MVVMLAGCQQRRVRVEMTASDAGVARSFASNALDEKTRERLSDVYAATPQEDSATGGVRFDGSFDDALPSEVGNRNGLTETRTDLGSAWFYFESFDDALVDGELGAESSGAAATPGASAATAPTSDWSSLQERMAAGELWVRLFGRWAEQSLPDSSRREEFRAWVDAQLVPFAQDFMLRYGAMQAVAQSARIGGGIRDRDQRGRRSDDEAFYTRVFMPLLLTLGAEGGAEGGARSRLGERAVEMGLFTPEELHWLLLLSLDGNAGGSSRDWSLEKIFLPAINRQVRRWKPDAKPQSYGSLTISGIGFLLWATSSPDRDEILLASSAIPEADKARVRSGDRAISLPPPYGVDPRRRAKSIDTEVRLTMAEAPYLSNGVWDAERKQAVFKCRFFGADDRTVLYQPMFYAAWSTPNVSRQSALFGEVVLRGEALGEYAIWRELLDPTRRAALDAAFAALAERRDPRPLQSLVAATEKRDPAPEALRRWCERVAKGSLEQ